MKYAAVVRIFTTSQAPDYDSPWQSEMPSNSTGSGVVIGPGRILTGAHVVANATFVQVQKVSDPDKAIARVVAVCHDADLALLQVDTPDFMRGIGPLAELGDLPDLRDRVHVVGYPVGGEEISVTEGVVSRVEVQRYSHSQRVLLAITVDAAINSGNSGGPVYKDGKIVGIAFQALQDAENIGELVPTTLISKFLEAAERGITASRLPGLGIGYQTLENPALRRRVGLREGDSGVLVTLVEYGGSAWGHLEKGDALLSIDGNAIANNGTIRYRNRFRTSLRAVLGDHHVGEQLKMQVLRRGEVHDLSVELVAYDSLVPLNRYDIDPTYLVYAGLVFQPLTRDFLLTWKKWRDAPVEFRNLYRLGIRTPERQEVVILTQVLADAINVGYEHLYLEAVVDVNGRTPRSMREFVEWLDSAEGLVELTMSSHGVIALDADAARASQKRICNRYHIQRARSADLESA